MKVYLFIVVSILVSSCASKYPKRVNLNEYEKGIEITDSNIVEEISIQNKCFMFDQTIPLNLPLIEERDSMVLYSYDRNDLSLIFDTKNKCKFDQPIFIEKIDSIFHWDGMKRLNIYKAKISVKARYICQDSFKTFSSTQEIKLRKHGKIVTLGLVGEEETKAMIAAVVVLAFDAAVSDIYSQINQHCQ